MRAIFASRNRHKVEQVQLLLPEMGLVQLDEVAPDLELEEPFDTFEANALAKARTVADATGEPAVADDSGLEVDALNGAPGVHSARYAGVGASDSENNSKLVAALKGVDAGDRTARYRCVAVLVLPDGKELVAEGSCEGVITIEPRGELGFGYDPHFIPTVTGRSEHRTMGEIPLEEKLAFSHRGNAFRALAAKLESDMAVQDSDDGTS